MRLKLHGSLQTKSGRPERLRDENLREKEQDLSKAASELLVTQLSYKFRPEIIRLVNSVDDVVRELNKSEKLPIRIETEPGTIPEMVMLTAADRAQKRFGYVSHEDTSKITFPGAGQWWVMIRFGWVRYAGLEDLGNVHPGTEFQLPSVTVSRFPSPQTLGSLTENAEELIEAQILPDAKLEVRALKTLPGVALPAENNDGLERFKDLLVYYAEHELVMALRKH